MVLGDTHGNTRWLTRTILPLAHQLGVDTIVQVGDFGYWEHEPAGVEYLNAVEDACDEHGIPVYWLHGNHDKHSLTLARYGDFLTDQGFLEVRAGVYYIPQGHIWAWNGVRMRAFGGAYSVDKQWRLDLEAKRTRRLNAGRAVDDPLLSAAETIWFPEEQMTDADMDKLLAVDSGPLDIVFSHDFPAGANPGPHFKTLPDCLPNQKRLQRALDAHRPRLWVHGHLHQYYVDVVGHDDGGETEIVGLAPDPEAAPRFTKPWHSWTVVDLVDGNFARFDSASLMDGLTDEEDTWYRSIA